MSKRSRRTRRKQPAGNWSADDWDDSAAQRPQREKRKQRDRGDRRRHDDPVVDRSPPVDARTTWSREEAWADLLATAVTATPRPALTCGGCRNWRSHDEPGGRGTCDHPGSGYSFPYENTEACPFYEPRRW